MENHHNHHKVQDRREQSSCSVSHDALLHTQYTWNLRRQAKKFYRKLMYRCKDTKAVSRDIRFSPIGYINIFMSNVLSCSLATHKNDERALKQKLLPPPSLSIIRAFKKHTLFSFVALSLCGVSHARTQDFVNITRFILDQQNNWCNNGQTTGSCGGWDITKVNNYYSTGTRTASAFGYSITQHYGNRGLVLGNSSRNPNKNATHWWGGNGGQSGLVGYANVKLYGANMYLTGTFGSGNAWGTGGGATVDFVSTNGKMTLSGAAFNVARSGTQNSWFNLWGNDITMNNKSSITINNGGGMKIEGNLSPNSSSTAVNTNGSGKINIWDTTLNMTGGNLEIHSANTRVSFTKMNVTDGRIVINDKTRNVHRAQAFSFIGTITNGSYANNRYKDERENSDGRQGWFTADFVNVGNNSWIQAHTMNIKVLEIEGAAGNKQNTFLDLNGGAGTTIQIGTLRNADFIFGQTKGYYATLNTNTNVYIDHLVFRNYTGGNHLVVNADSSKNNIYYGNNDRRKYDITIGKVTVNTANLAGSEGVIELYGKGVTINNISNIPGSVLGTVAAGRMYIDSNTLKLGYLNYSDYQIVSQNFDMRAGITNGSFANTNTESYFRADQVIVRGNSKVKADDVNINVLEMTAGPNWNANAVVKMDLITKQGGNLNIGTFRNGDYVFGQAFGYDVALNTNANVNIDHLVLRNFTGGNNISINTDYKKNGNIGSNNSKYDITIGKVTVNTPNLAGSEGVIQLYGKNVRVDNISNIPNSVLGTVAAGRMYVESDTLKFGYLNYEDYQIVSSKFDMRGRVYNGRFANTATESYFYADDVISRGNAYIEADEVDMKNVEITAGPNWNPTAVVTMEVKTKQGAINIGTLKNGGYVFGQGFGYTAQFKANADINVDLINHSNFTAGMTFNVEATDTHNIYVKNVQFNTDGILGSEGKLNLKALNADITIDNIRSCNGWCTGAAGIRPLNTVSATGKNFYGGFIQLQNLEIRTGTLKASDFHINNFTVWKSNSWSEVSTNIGKSFINFLSFEIGTLGGLDRSDLSFTAGGDILNVNYLSLAASGSLKFHDDSKSNSIKFTNINEWRISNAEVWGDNFNVNNLIAYHSGSSSTGIAKVYGSAMNINDSLSIKANGVAAGNLEIRLGDSNGGFDSDITSPQASYLNVAVDSESLKNMSQSEILALLQSTEANTTFATTGATNTDYKNASGTYIQTSDGKKFVVLPDTSPDDKAQDVIDRTHLAGEEYNAGNAGGILVEQRDFTKGTLNVYGDITLDMSFLTNGHGTKGTQLDIYGNLNNYGSMDIGGKLNVKGHVWSEGGLTFRIQADPSQTTSTGIQNSIQTGQLKLVNGGSITFDISPGSTGAFKADISDYNTLANLKLGGTDTSPTYTLVQAEGDATINYSYNYNGYTTLFKKDSISTTKNEGACQNTNGGSGTTCGTIEVNGNTQQETYWTTNGYDNPWYMDKAGEVNGETEKPSDGSHHQNGTFENGSYVDGGGSLIEKPSQADKYEDENGFGGKPSATEAERGYDYAQGRMESSFALTFLGSSIDGKYLQVEKIVTDKVIGFNVTKTDFSNFTQGDAETALCNANSSTFDCALYMEAGGNNSWINAIKKESANSYDILKSLFYNDKSELLFLVQLDQTLAASRNLDYFLEVARTLDTTFQHVSSLENKSSTLNTLTLAMDSAKASRLTKVALMHGSGKDYYAYQQYQKSLAKALEAAEKMRFSANDEVWFDTLADLVMRFNKREEYPNNAWINALGNISFNTTGNSQLYGFNAGYDYFIDSIQTAMGLYVGYGYGTFTGSNNGFLSNYSNNLFAGIYSRTFQGNHEYDVTINGAMGFVNETLGSRVAGMNLLDLFNQRYNYNINNIEANFTYGYAFMLKKGYVVKPFIGVSYYLMSSTGFDRETSGIFAVTTDDNFRQAIGFNAGVEGRKYFANQSYVFLLGQIKQDGFIISNNLDKSRHSQASVGTVEGAGGGPQTQFSLDYRGQAYRSTIFVTGGGEYSFGRFYVNGSLSAQSAIFDKSFGFGINLGARVIF